MHCPSIRTPSCTVPQSGHHHALSLKQDTALSLNQDTIMHCPSIRTPSCTLPQSGHHHALSLNQDTIMHSPSIRTPYALSLNQDTIMRCPVDSLPNIDVSLLTTTSSQEVCMYFPTMTVHRPLVTVVDIQWTLVNPNPVNLNPR